MKNYILSSAIFIILGGFIGCGIGALAGQHAGAASTGTGYGCLAGLLVAVFYYFGTRK